MLGMLQDVVASAQVSNVTDRLVDGDEDHPVAEALFTAGDLRALGAFVLGVHEASLPMIDVGEDGMAQGREKK